jgi:starch-binding outer membrane protein, SusD/RagB family
MESSTINGTCSGLKDIFNSTSNNYYFYQATPSSKMKELSRSQSNCIVFINDAKRDTLFSPEKNDAQPLMVGDLRLASVYSNLTNSTNQSSTSDIVTPSSSSKYSSDRQIINKFSSGHIILYRSGQVYLRFAEALNRAGFPASAFAVLKYGLYSTTISKYIPSDELKNASNLLSFSQYSFNANNTIGIHSRGAGDAAANKNYVIPALSSLSDSINYVEDLICNEDALETSFEGYRFFDLMRMAIHRNDNTYLADKIAGRKGASNYDQSLYNLLLKKENWYLPLK